MAFAMVAERLFGMAAVTHCMRVTFPTPRRSCVFFDYPEPRDRLTDSTEIDDFVCKCYPPLVSYRSDTKSPLMGNGGGVNVVNHQRTVRTFSPRRSECKTRFSHRLNVNASVTCGASQSASLMGGRRDWETIGADRTCNPHLPTCGCTRTRRICNEASTLLLWPKGYIQEQQASKRQR